MTKISALTSLTGAGVDQANDVLVIVDTSAGADKKITVAQLLGLVTDITGLLDFKGSTDCSANPNYPAASKGDYYLVSVAGKIGGASGIVVEQGDSFFATADNAGGTQAGVGTSWTVIQSNITYVPVNKAGDTMTGDLVVPDEAYDATNWNGSLEVPTKNAVRDKIESVIAGSGSVSDTTYGGSWDGDTTTAPSKNAVYDKIETITAASAALPGLPRGRLTLVTATSITTSDQTAKTSVFYTPHNGHHIPIYDGAAWADKAFAELTLSLDTSNQLSGNLYDVFVWNDAGTIKVGAGPAWSSGTSRGTGAGTTELELKDGIWTNKVSITLKNGAGSGTSGIAANTATYVGTINCTANGQTGDSLAGRYVWNAYNRVMRPMRVRDSTDSWSYATATWRPMNNNTANALNYVVGLSEDPAYCQVVALADSSGSIANIAAGIGVDSTSANSAWVFGHATAVGANNQFAAIYDGFPGLGKHTLTALEIGAGSGTQTWYGDAGLTVLQSGIIGRIPG